MCNGCPITYLECTEGRKGIWLYQASGQTLNTVGAVASIVSAYTYISLYSYSLYKCVLKPVWTYGIQLWGCAKPSHTQILQRFQSKLLRTLANAPWYVSNLQLHTDLGISFAKFRNLQIIPPLPPPTSWAPKCPCCSPVHTPNVARRLKRRWPSDLHSVTSD